MKVLLILATILGLVLLASATYTGQHRGKCSFVTRPVNGYGSGYGSKSIQFACRRGYYLYGIKAIKCSDAYGQHTWSRDLRPICISIGKFYHSR